MEQAAVLPARIAEQGCVRVLTEPGVARDLDRLAEAAGGAHGFLRAAWFEAACAGAQPQTLVARRADGSPVAAIPLIARSAAAKEVPGSYWPFRSFPIAPDASDAELIALLASREARAALGRAWRLGPVYADDPTAMRLARLALRGGWTVLERKLATAFMLDLEALGAEGPWPSTKTLRKNRWLERRLAEMGELEFRTVRGADWSGEVFDMLAAIERESWVGKKAQADTKFVDAAARGIWERAIADYVLARALRCSLLHIDGVPAAFTFAVESGTSRFYIANSYSERFADRSPGRILLYRDFQQAAEAGMKTIGWGAGDPGYKSEMGARAGPGILDLLIVRGPIVAALARPLWRARG